MWRMEGGRSGGVASGTEGGRGSGVAARVAEWRVARSLRSSGGAAWNGATLSSVAAPLLPVVERSHTAAEPALQPPHSSILFSHQARAARILRE